MSEVFIAKTTLKIEYMLMEGLIEKNMRNLKFIFVTECKHPIRKYVAF